jgi:hypothetical protein
MLRALRRLRRSQATTRLDLVLILPIAAAGLCAAGASASASPARSGLVVVPHPSVAGLSYFKLAPQPGGTVHAGTIELRNPTARRLRVVLSPVDGETLSTLGSSYAPPGSRKHGATLWLRLGTAAATLSPGASLDVPVAVTVPSAATPGDYLSGISVEALNQGSSTVKRKGVAIASVERYAIGAEVSLPGPRHRLIQFTGASIRREPGGLSFALEARNSGNAILQGVHGQVRITRGGHTVVSQAIGPGTFLADSSIAYPINAFHQTPPQGTRYRVSAWMAYPGGVARLDTTLLFGHRAAVAQQQYGGPPASAGGTAWWKIAGIVAAILYGMGTTTLLLRRRIRRSHKPLQP